MEVIIIGVLCERQEHRRGDNQWGTSLERRTRAVSLAVLCVRLHAIEMIKRNVISRVNCIALLYFVGASVR